MSTIEILVSVVCLLLGYWIFSALTTNKKPPTTGEQPFNGPGTGAGNNAGTGSSGAGSTNPGQQQAPGTDPMPRKQPWYEVLDVSKNATLEEVQAARRSLMSQYHPDKVASLGPEFRQLAEEKSKAINQAYNEALAEVGTRTWS